MHSIIVIQKIVQSNLLSSSFSSLSFIQLKITSTLITLLLLIVLIISPIINQSINQSITGPYSVNGVPLRRVNQRYVIATNTSVSLAGVNVSAIEDDFFAREKATKKVMNELLSIYSNTSLPKSMKTLTNLISMKFYHPSCTFFFPFP